jgi:predicted DNA-binding antitoxin AbrB/MazE fold protein
MTHIAAVFEQGVFRPLEPVRLPEHTSVVVGVPTADDPASGPEVWEILFRRTSSEHMDTAARIDDHQP